MNQIFYAMLGKQLIRKLIFISLIFSFFTLSALASEESEVKFNSVMNSEEGVEPREAIRIAEEAVALDPNVANYYTYLGNVYHHLKDYDRSESNFKKALSIDSKDSTALNGLGLVCSKRGQSDKAVKFYRKAIAISPDLYGMYINLGMEYIIVFEKQGKVKYLKLAKDNLQKAIELNKNAYDAYQYLGKVFLDLKDYDNAIKVLEKVIKINPEPNKWLFGNLGNAYYDLGAAYYNKNMFKEAIIAFKKSLEIIPDAPDAIFVLGACYTYLGDKDGALKYLGRLAKLDNEKASKLNRVITAKFNDKQNKEFIWVKIIYTPRPKNNEITPKSIKGFRHMSIVSNILPHGIWEVGPDTNGKIATTNSIADLSTWHTYLTTQKCIELNGDYAQTQYVEVNKCGLIESIKWYEDLWVGQKYIRNSYNENYAVKTVIYGAGGDMRNAKNTLPEVPGDTLNKQNK